MMYAYPIPLGAAVKVQGMIRWSVEFEKGARVDSIEIDDGWYAKIPDVIEAARKLSGNESPARVVYRMDPRPGARYWETQWKAPEQTGPHRVFLSYVHTGPADSGIFFDNGMLDIDFEPFTPEQVAGIEKLIAQSENVQSVKLLHWQCVEVQS